MIIRLLGSPWPRYIPLSNKGDPRITLLYFKANYHYKISERSYTCTVVQVLWIRMPLSRIACWHNSSESWHPCIRNQLQFGFSLWLQRQSIRPVSFPQRSGIMKKTGDLLSYDSATNTISDLSQKEYKMYSSASCKSVWNHSCC